MSSFSLCGTPPPPLDTRIFLYVWTFWQFNDNDNPIFSHVRPFDTVLNDIIPRRDASLLRFERNCICRRDRKLDVYRLSLATVELRWMAAKRRIDPSLSRRASTSELHWTRISMVLETWPKTSVISFRECDFRFALERLFKLNRIRGRVWISWRFIDRRIV